MTADVQSAHDQALMRSIVAREQSALQQLFSRYASTALGLAQRVIRDPMLAEDVVQEAFLSIWERPQAYQPDRGSVRAFVFAIVHNRAVDRVRRETAQQRRAQTEASYGGLDWQPGVDDRVVDALDRDRRGRQVRAALEAIPVEQRRIIDMMYFQGLTQRQVAEQLALPLGTVKSRTLLAMRKLHAALAE